MEKEIDTGDLLGALPPPNTQFSLSRGNSMHASAYEALDSLDEGAEAPAEPETKAVPKIEEPELEKVEGPKAEPSYTGPATPAQASPSPAPAASSSDNGDKPEADAEMPSSATPPDNAFPAGDDEEDNTES